MAAHPARALPGLMAATLPDAQAPRMKNRVQADSAGNPDHTQNGPSHWKGRSGEYGGTAVSELPANSGLDDWPVPLRRPFRHLRAPEGLPWLRQRGADWFWLSFDDVSIPVMTGSIPAAAFSWPATWRQRFINTPPVAARTAPSRHHRGSNTAAKNSLASGQFQDSGRLAPPLQADTIGRFRPAARPTRTSRAIPKLRHSSQFPINM